MVGGNGADFVNGGVGTDVEVLGNGDDTAAWNPGEGNDTIDGGLGRDTLAFNGSNGDEQMSLSANGPSAVFLRNLGNIRMDLDGVERLDLATFGGVDTVTIGDLSGTDVTTAEIDLAATTGAADAKDDTVQVNGTDQADRVDVAADGGAVEVTGLAAQTSVTGGDPTDRLQINTFGGDDSVTVSDAPACSRADLDRPAMTSTTPPRRSPQGITCRVPRFHPRRRHRQRPGPQHRLVRRPVRQRAGPRRGRGGRQLPPHRVRDRRRQPLRPAQARGAERRRRSTSAAPGSTTSRSPAATVPSSRSGPSGWTSSGSRHGEIVDAPYGSGLSFRDPDGIALEFFAPPA